MRGVVVTNTEEEVKSDAAVAKDALKKGRKRSSNSGGILNALRAKFGSTTEEKEEKKKKKEHKKSVDKRESLDSKSKFYTGNETDSDNGVKGVVRSNSSTFYVPSDPNENDGTVKKDAETDSTKDTETMDTKDTRKRDAENTVPAKASPVLPPKSLKRKSYHEQLLEKGLTPMEVDLDTKPSKPVRRKKKGLLNVDYGSDFSSTESLLVSDNSDSGKVKSSESQNSIKDLKDTDKEKDDDKDMAQTAKVKDEEQKKANVDKEKDNNNTDQEQDKDKDTPAEESSEQAEEKDTIKSIKRREKKRNVWNKDVFKSFTTEDMDVFHRKYRFSAFSYQIFFLQ